MGENSPLIRTPDQRLRVFVSSTLHELSEERRAATKAIRRLRLTPVLFELGARPHPPRQLYRAYLQQSHVFVGIYGEQYGWVAPGMEISGLEDEYALSGGRPKLIYVKEPAAAREELLVSLLRRIEADEHACYKTFSSPQALASLLAHDLAVLLSERFESATARAPSAASTGDSRRSPRSRRAWGLGIASALVAVSLVWATGVLDRGRVVPTESAPQSPVGAGGPSIGEATSIAVLPFVDMSAESDQEYLSDGLSEELLNVLAHVPELRVISRTSSFKFKGRSEDVREIARQLKVGHVLEGSVRKSGRQLRITAKLVDAATGSHRWSETYNRDLDDIFRVQDEIAAEVVKSLRGILVGSALPGRSSPPSAEAYTLVLRGKYFADRHTKDDLIKAVSELRRAVSLYPGYANAWAELARVHLSQAGSGLAPRDEAIASARQAAEQALSLDAGLANAYALLGFIEGSYDLNWRAADQRLQRALKIDPNDAGLLANAALMARALGRIEESIELNQRGIGVDPLQALTHTNLAISLLYADRLDEAEAACRQAIELRPSAIAQRYLLGRILLARGEHRAAREQFGLERDRGWRLTGEALVCHALGLGDESKAALDSIMAELADDMPFQIAEVLAYRGEIDRAFEWLERALALHDTGISDLKHDPLLRNLEGDPRYRSLLRKMGLPED